MHFLINDHNLDRAEKIQLVLAYILQISLIIAILFFIYENRWINVFSTAGILLLTLLPAIIRRSFKVHLPIEIELYVIAFTFAALFLGEHKKYYFIFFWWDEILHFSSGILFGIVAFLLIYIINEEKPGSLRLSPGFIALFSFAFAVMIGILWEIFEFSMDQIFRLNMQRGPYLFDTIKDIILDASSALLTALLAYFYMKKRDSFFLEEKIKQFVTRNTHLFRKRKLFRMKLKRV